MDMYYSGVGSRETPRDVLLEMRNLAFALAQAGFTLRSGGADGADSAFEEGAKQYAHAKVEIFLPWKGFNENDSRLYGVENRALEMAASIHPAWHRLADGARKLHSRNCYQVLGRGLDKPSHFLVCWTSDGCESAHSRSSATGGTATAIIVAERHGVPVFNLGRAGRRAALGTFLERYKVSLAVATLRSDQLTLI